MGGGNKNETYLQNTVNSNIHSTVFTASHMFYQLIRSPISNVEVQEVAGIALYIHAVLYDCSTNTSQWLSTKN
jgi:hypothetical protein